MTTSVLTFKVGGGMKCNCSYKLYTLISQIYQPKPSLWTPDLYSWSSIAILASTSSLINGHSIHVDAWLPSFLSTLFLSAWLASTTSKSGHWNSLVQSNIISLLAFKNNFPMVLFLSGWQWHIIHKAAKVIKQTKHQKITTATL